MPEEFINHLPLDRDVEVGELLDPVNIKDKANAATELALFHGKIPVTTEEVVEIAKNQAWMLRPTHAQQQYQQGDNEGIMAMLHQAMRSVGDLTRSVNDLRQSVNDLTQSVSDLTQGVNDLTQTFNQRFDTLEQELQQNQAMARSAKVMKRNRLFRATGKGQYHLRPKENTGSGTELASRIHQGRLPPGVNIDPPPAIGSVPNDNLDPFHAETNDILRLISFYNDDFGIVPGDSIESQRGKLERWLTVDMT